MATQNDTRSPPYQLWEYKYLGLGGPGPHAGLEDKLNQFGQEGWELISADGLHLYFKRPYYHAQHR